MTDHNKRVNELTERASKLWGFPLKHNPTPPDGEGPVYYVTLVTTVDPSQEHKTRLAIEVGTTPPANTLELNGGAAIMRHVDLATHDAREASRRQDQLAEALQARHGGELGYYLPDQHNNRRKRTAEHKTRRGRLEALQGIAGHGMPQPLPLDMQDTERLLYLAAVAYQGFQQDGRGFLSEFTFPDDGPLDDSTVSWTTPDMANATADQLGEPRLTEAVPMLGGMVASYDPEAEFVFLDNSGGAAMVLKVPCPGGSCREAWETVKPPAMPKVDW